MPEFGVIELADRDDARVGFSRTALRCPAIPA
jgi:hypothetical protein